MEYRLRTMSDELAMIENVLSALEQREEFVDILTSGDQDRARQRLEGTFEIPTWQAKLLLDMPPELFLDEDNLHQLRAHAAEIPQRISDETDWLRTAPPRQVSRNLDRYGPNDVDEARAVLEPIVRSVLPTDELEQLDIYWHVIPEDWYPPRSGLGGSLGEDIDEGDPLYLWIRILARGEEFCINVWSPSLPFSPGKSWSEGVVHLADSLEDWVSEKVAWGQQRRVDDDLLPGSD